ncbi:MAG: GAF domain-containing protein [Myxococcaceae bacterium]|nr:GAF domain-containing protein [Myxococcaceae bacterium]
MDPGPRLPPGSTATAAGGTTTAEAPEAEAAARLRVLVELSRLLAEARTDLEFVLDAVAARVVELLGDGCAAYLRAEDDTWLDPITIRHREPARRVLIEQVNTARRLRIGEGLAGGVVASGVTLFLPIADPESLRESTVPEYRAYLESVGVHSLLIVPISGKERVHGALWLTRDPGSPPYTQADREFVEAIADCAAMALDSARLHSALWEDRQRLAEAASRMERLQAVTAALSSAVTPDDVAAVVAHLAVASMGGVAGSLVLPNEERTELHIVSHVGHIHAPHVLERFRRLPLSANNPVAHAFLQGTAFYFEDVARYGAQFPELLRAISEAGYQAAAALPLVSRGESLGVLWVRFATPRVFDRDERKLMSTMVAQSAQALERSRLYTRAQQAVTLRDEFLSVAAHELRTPLAAMKLQVQSLQRELGQGRPGEEPAARSIAKAAAVARQVRRLESLVTDLLDLSRITAGKLTPHFEEFDLQELAREVCDRMADDASCAGSTLTLRSERPVIGQWDRSQLDQVLSNFLSNAIKYGAARPIEVTVAADGARARLAVRDGGIGISPNDHARIFERFERATPGQQYSGFGVGLWICKQIVTALSGELRVRSQPGEGSTFEVELPLRQPR